MRSGDEGAECFDDLFIDLALEGYNEGGNLVDADPAPAVELRLVVLRRDIDLGIVAGETKSEPALLLAAVFPFQETPTRWAGKS